MNIRIFGLVATIVGSVLGAWWWTTQRGRVSRALPSPRERGIVIDDNTPATVNTDAII